MPNEPNVAGRLRPGGRNARNEPNFWLAGCPPFHYSSVPVRCRLRKTKPIPVGRDAACGSGFPARPSGLAVNRAKQTQFRQRKKKRQVLCEKGVMVNCTLHRPWQNKANCPAGPGGTRDKSAEQNQFGPGVRKRARAGRLGAPAGDRLCKTKPIARSGAPRRCPPSGRSRGGRISTG